MDLFIFYVILSITAIVGSIYLFLGGFPRIVSRILLGSTYQKCTRFRVWVGAAMIALFYGSIFFAGWYLTENIAFILLGIAAVVIVVGGFVILKGRPF